MNILTNRYKIKHQLKKSKNVFIMGHTSLDLDAIGSCLGFYKMAKAVHKNVYLIIDDKDNEFGVKKVLKEIKDYYNIITSDKVKDLMDKKNKNNLLAIMDTNKPYLLQNKELLKVFTNVLVLDHHEIDENSLACSLRIIDTSSSSTCEMICELIKESHITISPYLATILLSGIVLDTNNFTLKTKASTYYYAYYLTSLGASSREVQYLLKQDLGEYIKRQKPITNVIMINNHIALTKGEKNTIYRREDLAKMADTLIMFNEIEASFVIGKLNKTTVGISARSLGSIEVNKILNKLNGGGDKFNAASKISDKTVKEVEEDLKDLLKEEK